MIEIELEPRLLEYCRKKKYYADHKITMRESIEKEFHITPQDIEKIKKYFHQKKMKEQNILKNINKKYDVYPPQIQYQQRMHYENINPNNNNFKLKHESNPSQIFNYLDENTQLPPFLSGHLSLPKSKRLYTNKCIKDINSYCLENPGLNKNIYCGNNIMLEMISGMPVRTKKTYGYDDPFEHNFDYIDGDIQKPEHNILPFPQCGISTRTKNKKQINRDTIL